MPTLVKVTLKYHHKEDEDEDDASLAYLEEVEDAVKIRPRSSKKIIYIEDDEVLVPQKEVLLPKKRKHQDSDVVDVISTITQSFITQSFKTFMEKNNEDSIKKIIFYRNKSPTGWSHALLRVHDKTLSKVVTKERSDEYHKTQSNSTQRQAVLEKIMLDFEKEGVEGYVTFDGKQFTLGKKKDLRQKVRHRLTQMHESKKKTSSDGRTYKDTSDHGIGKFIVDLCGYGDNPWTHGHNVVTGDNGSGREAKKTEAIASQGIFL